MSRAEIPPSPRPHRRRVRGLWVSAGTLAAALAALGCRDKPPESAEPKAGAALTAQAAPGEAPCEQFITKLCGRAGEKSALCASGKTLGSVLPPSACLAGVIDFQQMEQQIDADRKGCVELAERLCKDLGPDTETCQMVREQTPQFPREQCDQLTAQYSEVLGELKQKEAQNQPLPPEAQARIAAGGAPGFGPENAKVTIVEFSDFQCPYCSRAAEVVHKIRERYGDKVRFVFRQFPLPMHQEAFLAAEAALVAHQQGKFWEFHDLLFANQRELGRDALEKYAKQINMNVPELERALDARAQKSRVDADLSLGEGVFVQGTPTVFINGKRVPNPTEFEPVAKMIDEALGA